MRGGQRTRILLAAFAALVCAGCLGALKGGTIGATPLFTFSTAVCEDAACAVAIPDATVSILFAGTSTPYVQTTDAEGEPLYWSVPASSATSAAVTVSAPGYDALPPQTVNVFTMARPAVFTLTASWPQPQARAPLALEPSDPSGLPCHADPIVQIPSGPDRKFWRGDAWGVTVPGLPFVYAGSSIHPERALTWFFDRWTADWQTQILDAYRQRGYTHFTLSWPDSRVSGGVDNAGQTPAQFAATAVKVHTAIPFVHVMLTSKDFDPANASADDRMAAVSPAIDALIAAGLTGDDLILGVGWELNAFNDPQFLKDFIVALHAKYPQFDLYVHFTSYITAGRSTGRTAPRSGTGWRAYSPGCSIRATRTTRAASCRRI